MIECRTIHLDEPNTLEQYLSSEEMEKVVSLKITGKIGKKDFDDVLDEMCETEGIYDDDDNFIPDYQYTPCLRHLDLGGATYVDGDELPLFGYKTSLESIILPQGIKSTYEESEGDTGLSESDTLRTLILPQGLSIVGGFACYTNLKDLILPEGLEKISSRAFCGCESIAHIRIPASVKFMDGSCFADCSIEKYEVDEASPYFVSVDGVIYSKDLATLVAFPSAYPHRHYVVPETTKRIGDSAFLFSKIEKVSLPLSLQYIDYEAFRNCSIRGVIIPHSVRKIDGLAFGYCNNITEITVPASVEELDIDALWSDNHISFIMESSFPPKMTGRIYGDGSHYKEISVFVPPDSVSFYQMAYGWRLYNIKSIPQLNKDKEYPATHSMSTAWYVVDEDGNVGIMDIEDNGPVPWETEQTSTEELVFGHEENGMVQRVDLTDDQILDLIGSPHSPGEEELWFDAAVMIDKRQEQEFLALARSKDIDCSLLSQKLGLYEIDAYKCLASDEDDSKDLIIRTSSLWKMLRDKMILKVYRLKDFFVDAVWDDDKVVYEHNFSSAPYFIYHQSYWNNRLAERINIPDHPVKLDQFPAVFRQRICRIPVRFHDCERFQLAQWAPCDVSGGGVEKHVDGCTYTLLPLTEGGEAFILTDIDQVDFYPFCSERVKHHCRDCSDNCYKCFAHKFTNRPTVMVIVSPLREYDYDKSVITDIITQHSIIMPFQPRIPVPSSLYMLRSDVKKKVSQYELEHFFMGSHWYLDYMMRRFRPRVIIIGGDAYVAMRKVYKMSDGLLYSDFESFPFYMETDIEAHRSEIEILARQPYRGKEFPLVISKERMEQIADDEDD